MRRAALLLLLFACGLPAAAQQPERAGEVRALVPLGHIQRAGLAPLEAKREDPVFWEDILRTARGGRMRIGLLDGSILNVGSESQLHVRHHDPQAQETLVDLEYGRMRAKAARIARPGGGFRVRTPMASVGVVGTWFILRVFLDFTEILCLDGAVRVRNVDDSIPDEVLLRAGEFTRVARGKPPTPAAPATEAQKCEATEETDLPAASDLSRVEASWPPAGCGDRADLLLRAWAKALREGKEVETPLDAELLTGTLRLGAETLQVEGGRATLDAPSAAKPPPKPPPIPNNGAFTPQGLSRPVPTKIWDPLEFVAGTEWRAPRAVLAGSAFYVLGPMGFTGRPVFSFGQQPTTLLWQASCGAGFLAPQLPGAEYDVTLSLNGVPVARGKMNLVEVSYRLPVPPAVLRGQQTSFGMDIRGLAGLERFTAGRPILVAAFLNQTPAIIGNLRSGTPGAKSTGETITYSVGANLVGPTGAARLDATANGRQAGMFNIGVDIKLDEALLRPITPLAALALPSR